MNIGSFSLDLFLLILIVDKPWVYGDETDNCNINVTVQRYTEYYRTSGDSATIECPVMYCQNKPRVKWYKYNETLKEFSVLHLQQDNTVLWRNENIFVLNFSSINKNDSGLYLCEASVDEKNSRGHPIKVIVQDYSNITGSENARNTTEEDGATEKNKMMIIYILSSLGALGLLIFCCFGLIQSSWKHQVKSKTVSSTLQMEIINKLPDGSAVYNQSNCKQANKLTSDLTHDKSVTNQLLPANQDSLVYVTLNHGEHFQRSEPIVETGFTEYAAIVLKN